MSGHTTPIGIVRQRGSPKFDEKLMERCNERLLPESLTLSFEVLEKF